MDEAVLDNLISLFRKRPREDWRRMLAVSAEWPRLAAPVFQRLDSLVQAAGEDELELLVRPVLRAPPPPPPLTPPL